MKKPMKNYQLTEEEYKRILDSAGFQYPAPGDRDGNRHRGADLRRAGKGKESGDHASGGYRRTAAD